MSERDQQKPPNPPGRVLGCDEWEDLIADALDGTLPPAEAAAFARHQGECALCAQMLKETEQGRAWIQYLAVEPEVPADLLTKILVRTTGQPEALAGRGLASPAQAAPAHISWHRGSLPPMLHAARQVARHAIEPRLMMTIAMAFFSIALTLNLTGVNLRQIHAADLQPSRLRATLTRQYYSTNEQVTKYYLNLRLVYEMEARVRELRRSTEAEPAALQTPRPATNDTPRQPARDGSGSPSSTVPKGEMPAPGHARRPGDALLPPMMVSTPLNRVPQGSRAPAAGAELAMVVPVSSPLSQQEERVFRALRSMTEDQAERSLA